LANGIGSAAATITSWAFICSYTIFARWWKNPIGRFMVMKAAAICMTGVITISLTVTGFTEPWDWLRYVQAGLWGLVSLAFIHHTRLVWKVNRRKKE
jgi:O-antigen/teichoic acid export membrane protein